LKPLDLFFWEARYVILSFLYDAHIASGVKHQQAVLPSLLFLNKKGAYVSCVWVLSGTFHLYTRVSIIAYPFTTLHADTFLSFCSP